MRVRPAVALATAVLGLVALSGCEKPTPLVTVHSGSSSVHSDAACYAGDGGEVSQDACSASASDTPELDVRPNSSVAVDVDRELAESGWRISINGQQATQQTLDTTYYRFGLSEQAFSQGPLELQVTTLDGKQVSGLWLFRLRQD